MVTKFQQLEREHCQSAPALVRKRLREAEPSQSALVDSIAAGLILQSISNSQSMKVVGKGNKIIKRVVNRYGLGT